MSNYYQERSRTKKLISGFGDYIEDQLADQIPVYLVTFMFDHISGSPHQQLAEMHRIFGNIYSPVLTRYVKKPRSSYDLSTRAPIVYVLPDLQKKKGLEKRQPQTIQQVRANDGLHVHSLWFEQSESRSGATLEEIIKRALAVSGHGVSNHDIRPVTHDPHDVADYVMGSIKRGQHGMDDVLILPRVTTELGAKENRYRQVPDHIRRSISV